MVLKQVSRLVTWNVESRVLYKIPVQNRVHHHNDLIKMLQASGLVPTRFLTLIGHLVLVITILLSREDNVRACLPFEHSEREFDRKEVELSAGLGVAIGLLVLELLGLLSGLSMFAPTVTLLSIAAHATACVALAYFALDVWDCNLYWWIFGFCSALPAFAEMLLMISVLGMKRNL